MKDFVFPMRKSETIAGVIYLILHMFILPRFVLPNVATALIGLGFNIDSVIMNAILYGLGDVFVLVFMFRFMRDSITVKWKSNLFTAVIIGFFGTIAMNMCVNNVLHIFTSDLINPNQSAVNDAVQLNIPMMFLVAGFMGPVIEEVLFRGVIFGNIRTKNRFLAYAVTAIVFSVYHLWSAAVMYRDWTILIYALQYIPVSCMLAWTYEKCGSIWAPITLHIVNNCFSVLASVLLQYLPNVPQ